MQFNPDWKEIIMPVEEYKEMVKKIGDLHTKLEIARAFILNSAICGDQDAKKTWHKISDEDQNTIG